MTLDEINFKDKNIYLAPYNNLLKLDEIKLEQQGFKIESYVDNYKRGGNIITPDKIKENSLIIICSPNYWLSIIENIHSKSEIYIKINDQVYIKYRFKINFLYIYLMYKKEYILKSFFYKFNKFTFYLADKFSLYLTRNLRKIKKIKKKGDRVFIIGNGPSLKISDLEKLQNEVTIAANKIYLAFQQTSWRPTYYTILDPLDIEEYYDDVSKYDLGLKFFPNVYGMKKNNESIYYNVLSAGTFRKVKCTGNILEGFFGGESVSFSMIDFALHLGYKEIYLLGFDHNYIIPEKYENSVYIISEGEKNHFHDEYRKENDLWVEPRLENITIQFEIIKDFCDKNNVMIYNSTRGGYLEIFDRKEFDTLFN